MKITHVATALIVALLRRLLRRATLIASWLLPIVPMLFPDRLRAAETDASATCHLAIKAGHFVDVVRGEVLERQVIIVEGDVIKSVGAEGSVTIPADATILDLNQAWVADGDMFLTGAPWEAWRAASWEEMHAAEAKGKQP